MSKSISFRDMKLIPKLAQYNEIELLHPDMDNLVSECLAEIGFDIHKPVLYTASKHRDMQNNVGIGFRAVGEISCHPKFANSYYLDITERLVRASKTDVSLAKNMAELMGKSRNYNPDGDYEFSDDSDNIPEDQLESDWADIRRQIDTLESIRDSLRGDCHNASGALKTYEEYKDSLNTNV